VTVHSRVAKRTPRLWALWAASRPSQLALILLLYALGVGISTTGSPVVADGEAVTGVGDLLEWSFLEPVIIGAGALVPVTVAVHYANEYADVETDALTDRTPFSGGSGALVETGLPRSFLGTALVVACVVSIGVLVLIAVTDVLSTAAVGLLAAMFLVGIAYSLQPVALVRRGIGEVANMCLGGLVLPVYGVAVVATPTGAAMLAVVPFTLLVGCNLLAVHWPDRNADAAVGKRTLAVRWSPAQLRLAYLSLIVAATFATVGLWNIGILPMPVALAHLAPVPFLIWGWTTLTRQESPLPAVAAMVVLAVVSTPAWWWVGLA